MTKEELEQMDKDVLVATLLSVNQHYLDAMREVSSLRQRYDKVRVEDLCSTVQEREAALKNEAQEAKNRAVVLENLLKQEQEKWPDRFTERTAGVVRAKEVIYAFKVRLAVRPNLDTETRLFIGELHDCELQIDAALRGD